MRITYLCAAAARIVLSLEVHCQNPLSSRSHSQTASVLFWDLFSSLCFPLLSSSLFLTLVFLIITYFHLTLFALFPACPAVWLLIWSIFTMFLEDSRSPGSTVIFSLHFFSCRSESHLIYVSRKALPIVEVDTEYQYDNNTSFAYKQCKSVNMLML